MPTRSNEQLCRMAQKGDTAARDILLEKNLVHTAAASGRWCGAERPRCGLSNSRH